MTFGPVPSAACSLRVRDSVCHVIQASFNMTPTLVSVPGRVFVDGSRSSIDVDIRCGLDSPGFEPRQGARCLVFSKTIQTSCIFIEYRDYLSVLKRREVEHSPPSVDFRNEWSCTSAHPLCFHGVDRYNFTCFDISYGGFHSGLVFGLIDISRHQDIRQTFVVPLVTVISRTVPVWYNLLLQIPAYSSLTMRSVPTVLSNLLTRSSSDNN